MAGSIFGIAGRVVSNLGSSTFTVINEQIAGVEPAKPWDFPYWRRQEHKP